MSGVIVNLHGAEHLARRRLENRLFRRDTFAWYEQERIPRIIEAVLAPARRAGRGELLTLARRTMMILALDVAGVDLPTDGAETDAQLAELYGIMDRLARASTVAHATGTKTEVIAAGDRALAEFTERFYEPSRQRRQQLVDAWQGGELDEAELPRDVLTTLLRNHDRLDLPADTVLREVAYFPWVGSHSTSNAFVHTMHHIFEWLTTHPDERDRLVGDPLRRQRFAHETLRLHPASPVAVRHALGPVEVPSGLPIEPGDRVVIHVDDANRDRDVFGATADRFDPDRALPEGVAPWGLSFGHGVHACLGQELAGGLEPGGEGAHLVGAITVISGVLLAAGARPDPADPAALDPTTTRQVWASYPVLLGSSR